MTTIKIISCEVMKEELLSISPDFMTEFEFVSMGLHLHPEKLRVELQDILNRSSDYSWVILGFGLCGGALRGLKANNSTLIIPKVHDCVPILLGSKDIYEYHKKEEKGTFYLSCGWMISEKDILTEHKRVVDKYGEKKALSIIKRMYDSYKRVLFIHTGCPSEAGCLEQSMQIADLLELRYEEVNGKKDYMTKLVNGPWDEKDFIHIPPHGIVEEDLFGIYCK